MKKIFQLALVLSVGSLFLLACSSTNKSDKKAQQTTSSTTKTTTSKSRKTTTQSSSSSSDKDKDLTDKDVQQIGTDQVGYVNVPADWIRFTDAAGGESYQYSATDAYTIITMFSYDKETLGVEKIDDAAAEQAANSYAYALKSSGNFENLTGAKAKIAGYEAYQVYANAKSDGKFICSWIFVTEAKDKVYLVSLEGQKTNKEFLKVFAYIEKSWSAKKK